jgi:UDP-glucose 4-epimerase
MAAIENNVKPFVLVTGGAGYIGSHTCLELLNAGERLIVVDNHINSDIESLNRVRDITKCDESSLVFRKLDVCDADALEAVFTEFSGQIGSCIHFAGLKAVGESVAEPVLYYENNLGSTVTLLKKLKKHGVRNLVFSSSATVYGDPESLPVTEDAALRATNPYGRTKLFIEEILRDSAISAPDYWRIVILRYFNPIGAHVSGRIGEDPSGIPNNVMPFISQVCVGRRPHLGIFGSDWNTPDGTGVRDYIHVVDLALGHLAALKKLTSCTEGMCRAVNLGTGTGISVLELLKGMEKATGKPIPYQMTARRAGDIATVYCDPKFAEEFLGWKASRGLDEMCADAWRWQSNNPQGYSEPAGASS